MYLNKDKEFKFTLRLRITNDMWENIDYLDLFEKLLKVLNKW